MIRIGWWKFTWVDGVIAVLMGCLFTFLFSDPWEFPFGAGGVVIGTIIASYQDHRKGKRV